MYHLRSCDRELTKSTQANHAEDEDEDDNCGLHAANIDCSTCYWHVIQSFVLLSNAR